MLGKALLISLGTVIVSYYWFQNIKTGPIIKSKKHLQGKTVLITGGNSGIGKVTALSLAKKGARVIIASRNMTRSVLAISEMKEESKNLKIIAMKLDLANFEAVRSFAIEFEKAEKHLDYLINNAGAIDVRGRIYTDVNRMFATNYFGHFLLTNLLLEKMKGQSKKRPVRIINLSSSAYKLASLTKEIMYSNPRSLYEMFNVYAASSLAIIYFTTDLHQRLLDYNITVYAVHPGFTATQLGSQFSDSVSMLIQWIFKPLFFRDTIYGIQTIMYCTLNDGVVSLSGGYFEDGQRKELYPHATNETLGNLVWEESLQITGLDRK